MTNKSATAAAGVVTGLLLGTAAIVAVNRSPKVRLKRISRRAGQTMDAVGTMLQSMATMTR